MILRTTARLARKLIGAHDMNERIKELLEQAGVKYVTMPKDTVYEKFAELIVLECALIAFHNVVNLSSIADAEDVEANIKEHFGVDE